MRPELPVDRGLVAGLADRHRDRPEEALHVGRITDRCRVLGPGTRAIVWVQGCSLRCTGCIVPESHSIERGRVWSPEDLADRLLGIGAIDGVTFSGGEPFLQAHGLRRLAALLRAERPGWTVMSYSGYRHETVKDRGTFDQRRLLETIDILIDGPYVQRWEGDLLWRGSSNQRILGLTPKGREALAGYEDRSAGIELELSTTGKIAWNGVPPPGFLPQYLESLAAAGLRLRRHPDPDHEGNSNP